MVSEGLVHYGGEGIGEQSSSHHGDQEAKNTEI
jgi:hypothetical protein